MHGRSRGPSLLSGCVVLAIVATTAPSDSLSAPAHFPETAPVIGPDAPVMIRSHRAEEGLPSSRRHHLAVPRPLPRRVPRRCTSRLFASSMAFAQWDRARLPLYTFTRRQASLDAADRRVARPRGPLVIPLRRRPLNRRRGPATGLPGDYPDRTHTGWRRRTYGWATGITSSRPNLLGTLPELVEVRWRSPA